MVVILTKNHRRLRSKEARMEHNLANLYLNKSRWTKNRQADKAHPGRTREMLPEWGRSRVHHRFGSSLVMPMHLPSFHSSEDSNDFINLAFDDDPSSSKTLHVNTHQWAPAWSVRPLR